MQRIRSLSPARKGGLFHLSSPLLELDQRAGLVLGFHVPYRGHWSRPDTAI